MQNIQNATAIKALNDVDQKFIDATSGDKDKPKGTPPPPPPFQLPRQILFGDEIAEELKVYIANPKSGLRHIHHLPVEDQKDVF